MPESFKVVCIGAILSLVGLFLVQRDLRLRLFGKAVLADVMMTYEKGDPPALGVDYRFMDDKGEPVLGGATVPLNFMGENPPKDPDADYRGPKFLNVRVVYVKGNPSINRLATASSVMSFIWYATLIGGVVLLFVGAKMFRSESIAEAQKRTQDDLETIREMTLR